VTQTTSATEARHGVVVGVFDRSEQASQAMERLQDAGIPTEGVRLLTPPGSNGQGTDTAPTETPFDVLIGAGVPEGQARFYTQQIAEGRSAIVLDAGPDEPRVRATLQSMGAFDAETLGEDLVRGEDEGRPAAAGPASQPADVTRQWGDVRSRYETLWAQHFGARGDDWERYEPFYRYGWELANSGLAAKRPWSEAEQEARRELPPRLNGLPLDDALAAVRDVWLDVADEANIAQGGAERRTEKPFE